MIMISQLCLELRLLITVTVLNASRSEFFSPADNYMQLTTGLRGINNNGTEIHGLFSLCLDEQIIIILTNICLKVLCVEMDLLVLEKITDADFPAFSAAWRISGEDFMSTATGNWLNDLKLRVGYGLTGNDRVGDYNSFTNFAISYNDSFYAIDGSNTTAGSTGFYQSTLGNPNVKWETTTTTNIGVDLALTNNFTASVDLWNRYTSDMLFPKQIPMISGRASAPSINVGEMKNRGFDIELGYMGYGLGRDLNYRFNLNVSHYKNEIVKLSDNESEFLAGDSYREMVYTRSQIGTSFPEFYGYRVEGIFQNQAEVDAWPTAFGEEGTYNKPGRYKFKDINGDGVINSEDREYIGSHIHFLMPVSMQI